MITFSVANGGILCSSNPFEGLDAPVVYLDQYDMPACCSPEEVPDDPTIRKVPPHLLRLHYDGQIVTIVIDPEFNRLEPIPDHIRDRV